MIARLVSTIVALASQTAFALDLCESIGQTTFSPRRPGVADRVAYSVELQHPAMVDALVVLSRAQLLPANRINIDAVVASGDPTGWTQFANNRRVDTAYRLDDRYGDLGALPLGTYQVTTAVRRLDATIGVDYSHGWCAERETTLDVRATPGPTELGNVVEYYHGTLDHFFLTLDPTEISALDRGVHPGWSRTGQSFKAYVEGTSDGRGRPACRNRHLRRGNDCRLPPLEPSRGQQPSLHDKQSDQTADDCPRLRV